MPYYTDSYNHGQKLYGQLRKTALSLTPQAMHNQFKRASARSVRVFKLFKLPCVYLGSYFFSNFAVCLLIFDLDCILFLYGYILICIYVETDIK